MSSPHTDPTSASHVVPGPILPEVQMHLQPPTDAGVGVVVETRRCTANPKAAGFVRHVAIDVSRTKLAGNFRSGQSFGVIPPGVDETGKPHKLRLYSIASPTSGEDGQGRVLATTVKRLLDEHTVTHKLFTGVASNYLCDLDVGDEVRVTGPNGKRFILPADATAHDYVFFATGTGIAPFRGMLLDLLKGAAGRPPLAPSSRIVLVLGSPYASDLLYDRDLKALAAEHSNFTYLTAISRETQADGHRPMYVQDRLTSHRELLSDLLASPRGLLYICGIAGMELGIFQKLATTFKGDTLEQYLQADAATLENVKGWERRMIHKDVKPTRRVFLEVY